MRYLCNGRARLADDACVYSQVTHASSTLVQNMGLRRAGAGGRIYLHVEEAMYVLPLLPPPPHSAKKKVYIFSVNLYVLAVLGHTIHKHIFVTNEDNQEILINSCFSHCAPPHTVRSYTNQHLNIRPIQRQAACTHPRAVRFLAERGGFSVGVEECFRLVLDPHRRVRLCECK